MILKKLLVAILAIDVFGILCDFCLVIEIFIKLVVAFVAAGMSHTQQIKINPNHEETLNSTGCVRLDVIFIDNFAVSVFANCVPCHC